MLLEHLGFKIKTIEDLSEFLSGLFESRAQVNKTRLLYNSADENMIDSIKNVCEYFGLIVSKYQFSGISSLAFSPKTISKIKLEFLLKETQDRFKDFLNTKSARSVLLDDLFFNKYSDEIKDLFGMKMYNRLKYSNNKMMDRADLEKLNNFIGDK